MDQRTIPDPLRGKGILRLVHGFIIKVGPLSAVVSFKILQAVVADSENKAAVVHAAIAGLQHAGLLFRKVS